VGVHVGGDRVAIDDGGGHAELLGRWVNR